MEEGYIVWVKKLGQRHYAKAGFYDTTLCGMPMLGNNYANKIPESEQEECRECAEKLKVVLNSKENKLDKAFSIDNSAKGKDKRMLTAFATELEKKGWRRRKGGE